MNSPSFWRIQPTIYSPVMIAPLSIKSSHADCALFFKEPGDGAYGQSGRSSSRCSRSSHPPVPCCSRQATRNAGRNRPRGAPPSGPFHLIGLIPTSRRGGAWSNSHGRSDQRDLPQSQRDRWLLARGARTPAPDWNAGLGLPPRSRDVLWPRFGMIARSSS